MIRRFFQTFHKIFGLLLSLLFLMWFLSGIVMIWHGFPRASQEYKLRLQEPLYGNLPAIEEIIDSLPDSVNSVGAISISRKFGRPVAVLGVKGGNKEYYIDSLSEVESGFNDEIKEKIIKEWCKAPVLKIDTLQRVDQWIPFERLKKELPIYRYYFNDEQEHQLYISSQNGSVIQFTDKDSRFWAKLGAIPHWVYFTLLRQHQNAWTKFVIWSASIGCIMCLCGMFVAVSVWWKQRKSGTLLKNPYKKRWHRWHFVSGLVFGLFAITFAFSGVMSMTDVPGWLKKRKPEQKDERAQRVMPRRGQRGGKALPAAAYLLDYRTVIAEKDSVKALSFESWKNHPYYRVSYNTSVEYIDALDSATVKPFELTFEMIEADAIQKISKDAQYSVELLTEYDKDYFARKKERAPLPVYKVTVQDYMNTCLYYNPKTLQIKQVDDDTRTRSFLYGGLHRLDIKFLTDRPVLWHIVMLTLLVGGSFLSLTGVVLTLKWLARNIKKILNYLKKY